MESKYVIKEGLTNRRVPASANRNTGDPSFSLNVNELFYDTIQGEGVFTGQPSIFLRLQGCTLDCVWCDTEWRKGSSFLIGDLFKLMELYNLIDRLRDGHHLVITGGSPLKQQEQLINFITQFVLRYWFTPFIEIENECTILPSLELSVKVSHWNNSPKLFSSGMKEAARYKPKVFQFFKQEVPLTKVSYKFVVSCEEDWDEIQTTFIEPKLIEFSQIILMPLGSTIKELEKNRPIAVKMAIKYGVRYSSREQVMLGEL